MSRGAQKSEEGRSGPSVRPVRWLRDSGPEEIAEALLAVDPEKAVRVVVVLASRCGPEIASRVDDAVLRARKDPPDALLRAGASLLRGFIGRT